MFVKLNELIDPINTWNSTREMGQVQQETPPKGIVTYVSNAHMPFVTNNSSLFHSTHEYLLYKILKIKVHKNNSQIYHPNTIINNSEYFLSDCFLCMGRVLSVFLNYAYMRIWLILKNDFVPSFIQCYIISPDKRA